MPLALSIALREQRNGFSGFYVFIACVALGVAAIAGVGALADALRTAIGSPELRLRLGQAARARVERDCSFALRMQRVFAVYDRLS